MNYTSRWGTRRSQQGIIMVLTALLLPALVGVLALAIDIGLRSHVTNRLKSITDLAASSAAIKLHPNLHSSAAERSSIIKSYMESHAIQGVKVDDIVITEGFWDTSTNTFQSNATPLNALKVSVKAHGEYYFATLFNLRDYDAAVDSIVTISDSRPLAISILFDASTNMSLASQFNGINFQNAGYQFNIPSGVINDRLIAIDNELRNINNPIPHPPYGNLSQTNQNLSGTSMQIQDALALNSVPYPYSGEGASWDNYINYVKSTINPAYQNLYSMMTLINYWQELTYTANQVPNLQYVSEYPLVLIKNNVNYFLTHLKDDDLVLGLIRLNTTNIQASPTSNGAVYELIRGLQAGQTLEDNATAFDSLLHPAIQNTIETFFNSEKPRYKRVILIICTFTKCGGTTNLGGKSTVIKDYIKKEKINLYYLQLGIPKGYPEYNAVVDSYGGVGSFLGDSAAISDINFLDAELKAAIDAIGAAMKRTMPHVVIPAE